MPLDRLRNVFFSRHATANVPKSTAPATSMMNHPKSQSWSSTHPDFTCLRFFVWTGGDPGFTLTTAQDSFYSLVNEEDAELRVDQVTDSKVWEAGIRPGDVLETVSGRRVHTMCTEAALVLVQMSKKPSIIRFRSSSTSTKRMRYDIVLKRPQLGAKLAGDGSHEIPIVIQKTGRRLSLQSDSIAVSETRLGDVLVAVNGKDTVATGLKMAMKYLETCPRPVKLTFERSLPEKKAPTDRFKYPVASQDDPSEVFSPLHSTSTNCEKVVIKWEYGPLGVTMLEDAISGVPIVNRLTGKGSSANMERLQHGFYLFSINGRRIEGCSLSQIYRDLLMLPKPVTLVFCPPRSEKTSDEVSEYQRRSDSWSSSIDFEKSSDKNAIEPHQEGHRATFSASIAPPRSRQASFLRDRYEYEVVWASTRLGLQLKMLHEKSNIQSAKKAKTRQKALGQEYPIVYKVLKDSTLDLPPDAVGHLFVSINNWSIAGLGVAELRTLLGAASKPALLRFRRRDGLPGFQRTFLSTCSYNTDDEGRHSRKTTFGSLYRIFWSEGKLGIVFGCYEEADPPQTLVVYVKSIGPGQAQRSKLVAIGDILCSINGHELPPKQQFKKKLRALMTTMHPVTLVFRRRLSGARTSDWTARATIDDSLL